ncbi:MAG: bifunctional 5,10-methylene-tetrahydrofolate dehydrogenase/5,10-methylene-tetrahydrofolate cyclohydrolase [Pseudonocardiaceae bacterium]|nr:bifunctional 5,10-methylene-tetrahydrofolate dehydrogenase/5,10-methylene-tetrahydrofolate cyclohydrolase [Pseudonocardiaceae bacterium]
MTAHVIDGKSYAAQLRTRLAGEVRDLAARGARPGLATLIVGDSYPAHAYERRVARLAADLDCHYVREALPADTNQADTVAAVGKLNADPRISGILILRPLPDHISETVLYRALDPLKDIEAVHPVNAGLLALDRPRYIPSTPASVFHMLDRYLTDTGRDPAQVYPHTTLVMVGRSNNVGKPAILLGLARNATVLSCDEHSHTAGLLHHYTRHADILIVAAGVPGLITADHIKTGAIAIDVGINPIHNPHTDTITLVGDLDPDVTQRAEAISPVPGGVGPITDTWLLHNTILAAHHAHNIAAAQPNLDGLTLQTHDERLIPTGS